MSLSFIKYSGCGNDFILIDNRNHSFLATEQKLASLCHRQQGIGADGVILVEHSTSSDAKMRIFNADGKEAQMCGNAIRCVTHFLHSQQSDRFHFTIETLTGPLNAAIDNQTLISIQMPVITQETWDQTLNTSFGPLSYHFLNTGVPHAVFFQPLSLLKKLGKEIRNHQRFSPLGTNVTFVEIKDNTIDYATYERGVEEITLACGTGACAAAVVLAKKHNLQSPITLYPPSNNPLSISFCKKNGKYTDIYMKGPATKVFEGTIEEKQKIKS